MCACVCCLAVAVFRLACKKIQTHLVNFAHKVLLAAAVRLVEIFYSNLLDSISIQIKLQISIIKRFACAAESAATLLQAFRIGQKVRIGGEFIATSALLELLHFLALG